MQYISDAIQDISEYSASDFVNHHVRTYSSIIHPEDRETVTKTIHDAVVRKKPFVIEYRIIHADGSHFTPLEPVACPVTEMFG
jgi:hypothetical protein